MPKLANMRLNRAKITVAAEALIDSPTRASAFTTAPLGSSPERISSRTLKTRNKP